MSLPAKVSVGLSGRRKYHAAPAATASTTTAATTSSARLRFFGGVAAVGVGPGWYGVACG